MSSKALQVFFCCSYVKDEGFLRLCVDAEQFIWNPHPSSDEVFGIHEKYFFLVLASFVPPTLMSAP